MIRLKVGHENFHMLFTTNSGDLDLASLKEHTFTTKLTPRD